MNRWKFVIALLVLTMSGPALGLAQSTQTTPPDYFGHAAVGVWMEGSSGPYGYMIVHADGTVQTVDPRIAMDLDQGDVTRQALGFGLWQPVDDLTFESLVRIAWLDASVPTLSVVNTRATVSDDGAELRTEWKRTLTDESGAVVSEESGTSAFMRMPLELLEVVENAEQLDHSRDYRNHAAVGVSTDGDPPVSAYYTTHADGSIFFYNPWFASSVEEGNTDLATLGVGVWEPQSETEINSTLHSVFADNTPTTMYSFNGHSVLEPVNAVSRADISMVVRPADGEPEEVMRFAGSLSSLPFEAFDAQGTPVAIPAGGLDFTGHPAVGV